VTRLAWLAASLSTGLASILIAVSGGFVVSVGGVRMSARSWQLSAVAAAAAAIVWLWSAWRAQAIDADLRALGGLLEERGRLLGLAIAGLVFVTAVGFSSFSASGADASGYLSQAAMWAARAARVPDPLVLIPGWPLPPGATAPLGWRAALEPGWQVPTYAPGLPWLMASPHALAGITGAVLVVILSAAAAVWATGALAGQLGGGPAAVTAAALIATSPTFLSHAFQPMSDVPVTAAWMLCWLLAARRAPASAGVAAAIALMVRPNLAPLAAVPWVVTILNPGRAGRWARAARFAAPVAVAGVAIATLQWHWYGSPIRSGYGSASELFSLANVGPNARLYAAWLWVAEAPLVVCAVVAAVASAVARLHPAWRGTVGANHVAGGSLLFAAGVTLAYLVYAVFEVWSYLRFLLPAMAVAAALSGAAFARALRIAGPAVVGPATLALVFASSALGLHTARQLDVFRIAAVTARARDAGNQLARLLPANAVILAGEQSGSMRYATGRPVIRWESLDADRLRAVLAVLSAEGLEPWWVLDQFEEAGVRTRFAGVPEAALDWPPDVEAGPLMRTRAWRIPPLRTEAARPAP
jgi:hypothetical protein